MNEIPPEIFKHWIHSHEEDTENIKVYRPSNYDFPLSRGREGFKIKENGEFIQYNIGPDDINREVLGSWEVKGLNKIGIQLKELQYTISILSVDDQMLRIEK